MDLAPIDNYLKNWDKFAQGDSSLAPELSMRWPEAEQNLIAALKAKDPRALSRFVFLAVVQVGGSIPAESTLGHAWVDNVGEFPSFERKAGRSYCAPDLYMWWCDHKSEERDLPLLHEWASRDFAKKSVIPMFERVAVKMNGPGAPN